MEVRCIYKLTSVAERLAVEIMGMEVKDVSSTNNEIVQYYKKGRYVDY